MANTPKLPRNGAVGFIGWLGDLDLRCPAIHKEFDAGDEAAVIRGEKNDRLGNFFRRAGPPQRSRGGGLRLELLDLLIAQSKLRLVASCNDRSGLTTLTRMLRPLRSTAHVLANDRRAAFVAA